ncbi:MAG: fasciclin domain-containing protein, partial [Bacteroidia bacterium]|nr:fasciclin domain-containing protein [Bacteroidia bacterium]
ALDNGFSTLATAVITAELLPALTDPFALYTVFAPTNDAFDSLAVKLNTDLNGILALDNLTDVLLYHVVEGKINSSSLTNGPVTTLSGSSISVDISNGVMINTSNVTLADVDADNGIVHVIDEVLLASSASVKETTIGNLSVYPNPAQNRITINSPESIITSIRILNTQGVEVMNTASSSFSTTMDITNLSPGIYMLDIASDDKRANKLLVISSK